MLFKIRMCAFLDEGGALCIVFLFFAAKHWAPHICHSRSLLISVCRHYLPLFPEAEENMVGQLKVKFRNGVTQTLGFVTSSPNRKGTGEISLSYLECQMSGGRQPWKVG